MDLLATTEQAGLRKNGLKMGKKRKCVFCKAYFAKEEMLNTPAGYLCSAEHAISYSNKLKERAADKKRKENKKKLLESDLRKQLSLTQKSFNKMRVLEELLWFKERGLEPTCISCGKPKGGDAWACGHFKTVGASPGLRFDRKNAYLQHNFRCNMQLSGDISGTNNTHGYKEGLFIRFGEEEAKKIIEHCASIRQPRKWSCNILISMRKAFNKKIRRLENELS